MTFGHDPVKLSPEEFNLIQRRREAAEKGESWVDYPEVGKLTEKDLELIDHSYFLYTNSAASDKERDEIEEEWKPLWKKLEGFLIKNIQLSKDQIKTLIKLTGYHLTHLGEQYSTENLTVTEKDCLEELYSKLSKATVE